MPLEIRVLDAILNRDQQAILNLRREYPSEAPAIEAAKGLVLGHFWWDGEKIVSNMSTIESE